MAGSPRVIIVSGPNGSGKSTVAPRVLHGGLHVNEFVNADVIARGLSAFEPERVALAAGKIMLARLHELADARENFAFETTLASRSFAPWIKSLLGTGYRFHLLYFWLPAPEMSVLRVAARVESGGHHVPAETVKRRYYAGLRNFFELYQNLATGWRAYNNSEPTGPVLIASGGIGRDERVYRANEWNAIKVLARKG